jgi:hypothetical protein
MDQSHVAASPLALFFGEHSKVEGPTNGVAEIDRIFDLGLESVESVLFGFNGFEDGFVHLPPEHPGDDELTIEVYLEDLGTLIFGFSIVILNVANGLFFVVVHYLVRADVDLSGDFLKAFSISSLVVPLLSDSATCASKAGGGGATFSLQLATCGADGTVRIWDATKGYEMEATEKK